MRLTVLVPDTWEISDAPIVKVTDHPAVTQQHLANVAHNTYSVVEMVCSGYPSNSDELIQHFQVRSAHGIASAVTAEKHSKVCLVVISLNASQMFDH